MIGHIHATSSKLDMLNSLNQINLKLPDYDEVFARLTTLKEK